MTIVLVLGFAAAAFGTNCYVLAPEAGGEAVIVDPGIDVVPRLDALLAEHRLEPVAVLLTHGHMDHTYSAAAVSNARGIPTFIHPDDRHLLTDPMKAFPTEGQILFGGRGGYDSWSEPGEIRELIEDVPLSLAGLDFAVISAPGHTEGSVLLSLPGNAGEGPKCFAGDVIFMDTIGRTDLPGGSQSTMLATLKSRVLSLSDDTVLYPGHGPETVVGSERVTNPYLMQVAGEDPFAAGGSTTGR